ncbi:MAG: outer membrane beta-barrel protein [Holophagaceae bacterium]|nr:outer membrane beta-barrel protein [Holophagaceae bacterium]
MTPSSMRIFCGLLALSGAASALRAQEVRYGLQIHGNVPMGDLKEAADSKVGFGGGAHMTIDFGDGHRLRPRLDYVVYPENSAFADIGFGSSASGKSKVSDASLGLDYIYDFGGKEGGFYLTAGLAWHRWKAEYDFAVQVAGTTVSERSTSTSSKAGAAAGMGFNFNPTFGVEARYVATKFQQGNEDRTAGAVQVAALYRF